MTLKSYERKVLIALLELAAEQLGNRWCNDFNLKLNASLEPEEIHQINRDYSAWNGDLEDLTAEELESYAPYARAGDDGLLNWFVARMKSGEDV